MTSILELIPWETKPEASQEKFKAISWKGGTFNVPQIGYLKVKELDFIASADPKHALNRLLYQKAVELRRAIADPNDPPYWDDKKCFDFLLTLHLNYSLGAQAEISEEEHRIEITYNDIIQPFLEKASAVNTLVTTRSITAMMRRIIPEFTDEQTVELPSEMKQEIYNLYIEEQLEGKQQTAEDSVKELEKMLGKSLKGSPSNVTDTTGEQPIGSAETSGQVAQNSTETALESSPDTTSSKPSRKVERPKRSGFTEKKSQAVS